MKTTTTTLYLIRSKEYLGKVYFRLRDPDVLMYNQPRGNDAVVIDIQFKNLRFGNPSYGSWLTEDGRIHPMIQWDATYQTMKDSVFRPYHSRVDVDRDLNHFQVLEFPVLLSSEGQSSEFINFFQTERDFEYAAVDIVFTLEEETDNVVFRWMPRLVVPMALRSTWNKVTTGVPSLPKNEIALLSPVPWYKAANLIIVQDLQHPHTIPNITLESVCTTGYHGTVVNGYWEQKIPVTLTKCYGPTPTMTPEDKIRILNSTTEDYVFELIPQKIIGFVENGVEYRQTARDMFKNFDEFQTSNSVFAVFRIGPPGEAPPIPEPPVDPPSPKPEPETPGPSGGGVSRG